MNNQNRNNKNKKALIIIVAGIMIISMIAPIVLALNEIQ